MKVDHVLYGVQDLDLAAGRLQADYGLTSVGGGSHGELGTANQIIPLGDEYLELITVADPASQHPLAVVLGAWIADGDRFFSMAVEVQDLGATAERMDSTIVEGSRTTAGGAQVHFRLAGFETALAEQVPFFIEWGEGRARRLPEPGAAANPHARGVAWVELGGDATSVRAWLGGDVDGIRLVGGEPGVRAMGVATDDGEIVVT
jgi:glyoxalase-like protein